MPLYRGDASGHEQELLFKAAQCDGADEQAKQNTLTQNTNTLTQNKQQATFQHTANRLNTEQTTNTL
jgi:hypothetical protein